MEAGISTIDTVIVIAYLVIIITIGIAAGFKKNTSSEQFFLGGTLAAVADHRHGLVLCKYFVDPLGGARLVWLPARSSSRQFRVDGFLLPDTVGHGVCTVLLPNYLHARS